MERLRPVDYKTHIPIPDETEFLGVRYEEETRKGHFHGIVSGINGNDKHGFSIPYDYGLVEDSETGQLVKVNLTDITFTDRISANLFDGFFGDQLENSK